MLNPYTLNILESLKHALALRYWFFEVLGSESVKADLIKFCEIFIKITQNNQKAFILMKETCD